MTRQLRNGGITLGILRILPDLDQAVAASCRESFQGCCLLAARRASHSTGRHTRTPRHGIAPHSMRIEQTVDPLILLELQHADLPITRRPSEYTPRLMWCPGDQVHTGIVAAEVEGFAPWGTLTPYNYAAIV